jgi:hypothetical protein
MPAHKLGDLLAQSGELSALSRQARRLAELQQVLLKAVPPPLAKFTRVKILRAGTLFLLADNSAIAAKLRQLAPTLLLHVRKRESEVTGIQVEVQVAAQQPGASGAQSGRDLSLAAVNTLDRLAEALNESPLKSALTRMVRRRKDVKKGTPG